MERKSLTWPKYWKTQSTAGPWPLSKGVTEETSQPASSFYWAFTVYCLKDSSSMPKWMNEVISAQIKNDHAFFRRKLEVVGTSLHFIQGRSPRTDSFYFPSFTTTPKQSPAQLIPVRRSWFSFPLVLLSFSYLLSCCPPVRSLFQLKAPGLHLSPDPYLESLSNVLLSPFFPFMSYMSGIQQCRSVAQHLCPVESLV